MLDFLSELSENNNKLWFDENRNRWMQVKSEFTSLVQEFIMRISDFDASILKLRASDCIFRINRDIRFSNDKTPYKDWLGAYIIEGGRKNWRCGYYVHIQPNNESLIGAGLHLPQSSWLADVRVGIAEDGAELERLLKRKNFKDAFGEISGEKLKNPPRNFDKEQKYIELIKMKSFDIVSGFSDVEISNTNEFIDEAIRRFKIAKPINDFFNRYIDG